MMQLLILFSAVLDTICEGVGSGIDSIKGFIVVVRSAGVVVVGLSLFNVLSPVLLLLLSVMIELLLLVQLALSEE